MVINPGSGPGPNALPDANYTREIPILTSYSNVRLLGYVHTTYATRNISLVRKDIETYSAWPDTSSNPKLAVQGIFFDETPQKYSEDAFNYLQNLTDLVKGLDGLGSDPFVSSPMPPYLLPLSQFHGTFLSIPRLSFYFPGSSASYYLPPLPLSISLFRPWFVRPSHVPATSPDLDQKFYDDHLDPCLVFANTHGSCLFWELWLKFANTC